MEGRILINVVHKQNRICIEEMLADFCRLEYSMSLNSPIDLVIADATALKKDSSFFEEIKRHSGAYFLPFVLIDCPPLNYNEINHLVDEVVILPVSQERLLKIIKKLLMMRYYSKEAENRYHALAWNPAKDPGDYFNQQFSGEAIINSLEGLLRSKTLETVEHASRIKDMALEMGEQLQLSPDTMEELTLLAALHDIGKVTIPEAILYKPGKLNANEWEEIKKHPENGYHMIKAIPELRNVAEGILCHHERWDGTGYPQGIAGEEIPLSARILSILDAYDVMVSCRPYKIALNHKEALQEINGNSGTQFDPELAEVFVYGGLCEYVG